MEHVVEDHADRRTHSFQFSSPEGGLSVLQKSPDLTPGSWQDLGFMWGFQDDEATTWPLFSVPKTNYVPPNPIPPEPTYVSFLVEIPTTGGIILNWVSLEPSPLEDPALSPSENYSLRTKYRYQFTGLEAVQEDWMQAPIFAKGYGDYYYTFILYRTGEDVIPPYNEILLGENAAMASHFRTTFEQLATDLAAQSQAHRNAPPAPVPELSPDSRNFWRLRQVSPADLDFDGDNLSNQWEIENGSNWLAADTDGDGIHDGDDSNVLVNQALADPDGCNLSPELQADLLACWDFEETAQLTSGGSFGSSFTVFPQQAGSRPGYPVYIRSSPSHLAIDPFGMPSRATQVGTGIGEREFFIDPGFLTHPQASRSPYQKNQWSLSFWAKIKNGEIANNPKVLWSLSDFHHSLDVRAELLAVRRSPGATTEQWFLGGRTGNQESFSFWPVASQGLHWTLPAGSSDDGQWHHHVIVRTQRAVGSGFNTGYRYYRDGVLIGSASSPLVVGFLPPEPQSLSLFTLPRYRMLFGNHLSSFSSTTLAMNVSFDRLRAYGRELPADQVEALFHQDIDNDGLWDVTEYKTRQWQDLNHDAIADPGEFRYLISPYIHDLPHYDHDRDGLVSLTEQEGIPGRHGPTDPANPDTDNDSLPDGWESLNLLDPLSDVDASLDSEPDGLTNLQEFIAGTNPHLPDSNHNGIDDALDIPPLWVGLSRSLQYDFDDYGPTQPDAPKKLVTTASWEKDTQSE